MFSPKSEGSPPRVRGTAGCGYFRAAGIRITPACAGNRRIVASVQRSCEDHPRVCGEQQGHIGFPAVVVGSPPRVRGTGSNYFFAALDAGITPACAGNRGCLSRLCQDAQDHPRVCGEQLANYQDRTKVIGSPPRVRGTDPLADFPPIRRRITPACAGNSFPFAVIHEIQKDHPRVCGEQITPSPKIPCRTGSPPRVRGTVDS